LNNKNVIVIGAGLAGSEAAWQLANRGIHVDLYEMRPVKSSPAHQTDQFAELVCSNSLRAGNIENAVGLLKEEMRRLGSLIMECADATAVPAGGALAVDRHLFSEMGDADYLNCPMTEEEYKAFWHELTTAEAVQPKDFEKEIYFEGCMPVEIMASRGEDTLRYGPLKPVGLVDKRTNEESYAVVQLRKENKEGTMFNLVGFQTHLKWGKSVYLV